MADMVLYIPMAEYLRQWCINAYGGESPIKLRKNSLESHTLNACLRSIRPDESPRKNDGDSLAVIIPKFRFKNPASQNFLPPSGEASFCKLVRNRFNYALWNDLGMFPANQLKEIDIIYAWMDTNGIDPTEKNFNAIVKSLQRIRTRILTRNRVQKHRNSKKSY